MLLTGDIAAPEKSHSKQLLAVFERYPEIFKNKTLVCNFEGLLYEGARLQLNKPVLYNHPEVLKTLKGRGKVVAALANNHTLDLPANYDLTEKALSDSGIAFGGAGRNKAEADKPIRFSDNGHEIILYNACWDFLLYHQKNPTDGVFIAEIDESELIKSVTQSKKESPEAAILVFLHWSFDLETLPFPMYRQFAKKLVDAGANVVAGSHSHCVQGGEKYNNGYILYGLGNFFMPHDVFAQGKIAYPAFSNTELVLEWDSASNTAQCHWFEYQYDGSTHKLNHTGSDNFESSARLKEYSPFRNMDEDKYYAFFKLNRRKKKLIPIYRNYENKLTNWCFTVFLKNRARIARLLAQNNMIKWQN
jgi:poly-gamma-glutamate synthesis protein (capsule biosynthesis protein)